jgi:hypothetical protein
MREWKERKKECSPVPALQSLIAQQILLKEFKNLLLSEPTGSPKDQREEVVIEILDQPKETEDFGATVNMTAEIRKMVAGMSGKFRLLILLKLRMK